MWWASTCEVGLCRISEAKRGNESKGGRGTGYASVECRTLSGDGVAVV